MILKEKIGGRGGRSFSIQLSTMTIGGTEFEVKMIGLKKISFLIVIDMDDSYKAYSSMEK
jgi:hypothetical protein